MLLHRVGKVCSTQGISQEHFFANQILHNDVIGQSVYQHAHILLLGKYYIYSQKCQNAKPSLKGFIAKMKQIYSIELHIARKGDKLIKLISVVANGSI